ncbi:hypothetical protein IPZ60_08545 [Psychrobacter sp. NG25]|uniref:YqiA/YcfP family alpha/beta fold hydrolase n=1 Tax=Psychrobacter sp. NG25 TaxID=2782005 RepID=UPI001883B0FB|nr:YqiA/YcfP family alpha/beta fold hydrolase [Psychrobacter sp. NG25]MBF0658783.1 hypothetical protein [Psychrobacter sp. NG25]
MLDIIKNPNSFVLFFHGLDANNQTDKFTSIKRKQKLCKTVNYRHNFQNTFNVYDDLIQYHLKYYDRLVLAGDGLGAWFANHFAHQYGLPSLLIEPFIYPKESVINNTFIPNEMRLSFPAINTNTVRVIIVDNNTSSVATAKRTLVSLPDSWEIDYLEDTRSNTSLGIDINYHLNWLCNDEIMIVDLDYVDENAYASFKEKY